MTRTFVAAVPTPEVIDHLAPHPDRAKALSVGVATDDAGLSRLEQLAAGTRAALGAAGATVDGRRFRPHLTLARLGFGDNVTPWVRLLDAYQGPSWLLDEIALVASGLTSDSLTFVARTISTSKAGAMSERSERSGQHRAIRVLCARGVKRARA